MREARSARLKSGLTLAEAARLLGVSPDYLRFVESVRTGVPRRLARRLEQLYGTSRESFLVDIESSSCGQHGRTQDSLRRSGGRQPGPAPVNSKQARRRSRLSQPASGDPE